MRLLGPVLVSLLLLAVPASADRVVTQSGRTLQGVAPYEKVTVRLTECAACGYRWKVTQTFDPRRFTKLSNRYVAPPHDGTVGGPGTRVLVFRAKTPGTATLRLRYVGPDGSVAKRFTLTAHITAR
jgi:predicted secreted protein